MQRKHLIMGLIVALFWIDFTVSAISPQDRFVWAFWVALPVLLFIILAASYRFFQLTLMSYWLLLFMSFMFFYAAHYTFAQVPFGDWMKGWFGLERNDYDRLLMLAMGFFSSIPVREAIVRKTALKKGKMLLFLVVCAIGAASVIMVFGQWWSSYFIGDQTLEALRGVQGDIWVSQWHMGMAMLGAVLGQMSLMHLHAYFMRDEGLLENETSEKGLKGGQKRVDFSKKRHK